MALNAFKSQLVTLDTVFLGAPHCDVFADAAFASGGSPVAAGGIDTVFLGAPFSGALDATEISNATVGTVPVTFGLAYVGEPPGINNVTAGVIPVLFSTDFTITTPHASKGFFAFFGT